MTQDPAIKVRATRGVVAYENRKMHQKIATRAPIDVAIVNRAEIFYLNALADEIEQVKALPCDTRPLALAKNVGHRAKMVVRGTARLGAGCVMVAGVKLGAGLIPRNQYRDTISHFAYQTLRAGGQSDLKRAIVPAHKGLGIKRAHQFEAVLFRTSVEGMYDPRRDEAVRVEKFMQDQARICRPDV